MELSLFSSMLGSGLLWAISLTSPKQVAPGYFRSTLLVCLGLFVLAILAGWAGGQTLVLGLLIAACVGCYLGFVAYSVERVVLGSTLSAVTSVILLAMLAVQAGTTSGAFGFEAANLVASACLLGSSMAAMLLGHYYLTAPWMSLEPLKRLVVGIMLTAAARGAVEAVRLLTISDLSRLNTYDWVFYLGFRWVVGVAGPLVLAGLVWQTLKLNATQAATGIMYVIVIFTLIGETAGVAMTI